MIVVVLTKVAETTTNEATGEITTTAASEKPGECSGKHDRRSTCNKVNEMLNKNTDVHKIDNAFLRTFLDNNLQSHLRVPVADAIGFISNFSKIACCFTSMGPEVKKIVDEKLKSFTSCKSSKDSTDSKCSQDSSTGGQFDQITSKIKECVSSKAKGNK
ncbi:AAEL010231-PA [Aedes aegypti]|uniref:AAEL010231-PA n=1 Tax=Aedes aegypti TaxID=7159 RepID=Q16TH9_AEDAE|nr:AAEL010231-PA [Aedes aegypti]